MPALLFHLYIRLCQPPIRGLRHEKMTSMFAKVGLEAILVEFSAARSRLLTESSVTNTVRLESAVHWCEANRLQYTAKDPITGDVIPYNG